MRILYLTMNPNLGSTTRTLQHWLVAGRQRGLVPHVGVAQAGPLSDWLDRAEIPCLVDPMIWPDKWKLWSGITRLLRIVRACRRWGGIDLIHCNEHDAYPFGVLLARLMNRPVVCHIRYRVEPGFAAWAFDGWKRPDALLWTSETQRHDSAEAVDPVVPPERQHIVPLGIDVDVFTADNAEPAEARATWGLPRDAFLIGTASALRPRKRIEDFITLVARLAEHHPQVVGVLAGDARPGDEPYRETILQLVQERGLAPRFHWLGKIQDVARFYNAIDLFVSTSEYETFGMSVCEAMASRRPVVAYRGGSVAEVLGDAGYVTEVGDIDGLVEEADRLIRDRGWRQARGDAALDRIRRRFDPMNSLDHLVAIYRELRESRMVLKAVEST